MQIYIPLLYILGVSLWYEITSEGAAGKDMHLRLALMIDIPV